MSRNSKQHVAMPSFEFKDPDQMFICPFDPVHRVTAMRLPYHIRKCSRQYPCSNMVTCPFNARHVVLGSEIEKHVNECPDKQSIAKDFQEGPAIGHGYATGNLEVPEVNFEISNEESWDDDVDESVGPRGINFAPVDGDAFDELRDLRQVQQLQSEVFSQPAQVDLSGMSAAAKKNYKRAQKRKEQQAANAVQNGEADQSWQNEVQEQEPEVDPVVAEQQRQDEEKRRLDAITQQYLGDGKQSASFVDYKSILNIYCQKKKINPPVFREAPGPSSRFGHAFGAECIVRTDVFRSKIHAKRKKDALQDAAKQALLGLNIGIGPDPTPCRPAHMRTEEEMRRIRELDELNRAEAPLHQPRLNQMPIPGMQRNQLANQMGKMNLHQQQMGLAGVGRGRGASMAAAAPAQAQAAVGAAASQQNGDDEWTVVSGKKGKKPENPVYQHSLNMAGRGRGRMN